MGNVVFGKHSFVQSDVAAKYGPVNVFIGIVVVREGKRYKQAGVCHVALEGRLLHAE